MSIRNVLLLHRFASIKLMHLQNLMSVIWTFWYSLRITRQNMQEVHSMEVMLTDVHHICLYTGFKMNQIGMIDCPGKILTLSLISVAIKMLALSPLIHKVSVYALKIT